MRKLSRSDRKPKQVKSQRSTGQKVNVDDISMLTVQEMTWHDRTSMWQFWIGWYLGESVCDTWHIMVKWRSATWPNHGLPRGTPLLAVGVWFVY
jgi:hypothetical protein